MQDKEWLEPLDEVVELIVRDVQDKSFLEGEKGALYREQIALKVHENMEGFAKRFQRGYELLLEELETSSRG